MQTRTGVAFSPWDADSGVPLHAPPSLDLPELFKEALKEHAALLRDGPLEDDVELEGPNVSSPSPYPSSPCASGTSTPAATPQDADAALPESPCTSMPPTGRIFSQPIERPVAVPQAASPPTPNAKAARGAVLPDGLTREEYRRQKKRENERAKRRDERARKQAQIGDALKAAARRHRGSCVPVPVDYIMEPQSVHIASTGVRGKGMKAAPWHKKKMTLNAAKKLAGFNLVQWRGEYISLSPSGVFRSYSHVCSN